MKLTIRNSVRTDLAAKVPGLMATSLDWMKAKYPTVNFDNAEFIVSSGYNRSRYFPNQLENAKYMAPNVCISTSATLRLYDKKSLGIKKTSVFTGSEIQIVCALIHELTHHVQYETNVRKGNELDTTANELEYLKQFHTSIYNKILKIKPISN